MPAARTDEAAGAAGAARPTAWIGLGANLGDAAATVTAAIHELAALPDTRLMAVSSLYRSAPVDAGGPDFVNAVAAVATGAAPHALLAHLQAIELRHGRERPYRNAPRLLDLDLLLYDGVTLADATLTVPHPRMHARAFVLAPLAELAPRLRIGEHGEAAALLAACAGQSVERIAPPPMIAPPGGH